MLYALGTEAEDASTLIWSIKIAEPFKHASVPIDILFTLGWIMSARDEVTMCMPKGLLRLDI